MNNGPNLEQAHSDKDHFLGEINLRNIGIIPRILLTTNGTLTNILESCFLEKIIVKKILQTTQKTLFAEDYLHLRQAEPTLARKILLQGSKSERNYIYAESFVLSERVTRPIRDELLNTDTPLGKVLDKHKIESFKKFVSYRTEKAGAIAGYFNLDDGDDIFSRTFVVYSNNQPIMIITEKIPPLATYTRSE